MRDELIQNNADFANVNFCQNVNFTQGGARPGI